MHMYYIRTYIYIHMLLKLASELYVCTYVQITNFQVWEMHFYEEKIITIARSNRFIIFPRSEYLEYMDSF